eukprot:Gregarina_sp_Poly_1__9661@NODE_611_length_7145_cov_95_802063_g467_i0_p4_GENE_NODE_611_length_7145_cov_95_802063_g467_i0NODE_611_length_7145_cov_95_802063_g467_i0_p4_ORF_typecomplete_len267_score26_36Arg_tRNA_synt_N/PF03485_16/0_083_NODE_611_length_7145_cov_95_802063_g467_i054006200
MVSRKPSRSQINMEIEVRCQELQCCHRDLPPVEGVLLMKLLRNIKDVFCINEPRHCGCSLVVYQLRMIQQKVDENRIVVLTLLPVVSSLDLIRKLCDTVPTSNADDETRIWFWRSIRSCAGKDGLDACMVDLLITKSIQHVEIESIEDFVDYATSVASTLLKATNTASKPRSKMLLQEQRLNLWANQLFLVTGISEDIAKGLVQHFPTMQSLVEEIAQLNTPFDLQHLKIGENSAGQPRCLGKKISSRLYHIYSPGADPQRLLYLD